MATMGADRVFVDTNILIAANVTSHPRHDVALQLLKDLAAAGTELWISRQVLREYLATLTRSQTYAAAQPIGVLATQVAYFLSRMHMADDTAAVTSGLLTLMQSIPIGGKQVHDANIVATMQAYNISRLLTDNISDFNRYTALITIESP